MLKDELRIELEAHYQHAYAWALSCCGWEQMVAEDVLQTSILKVLDGRARFAGRSSFRTWFFEVIRRTAADQRRRQVLRRLLPLEPFTSELRSSARSPLEQVHANEESARLIAALKALPRRQREVLHLVFFTGLTIREASETLGITLGTARTHYERGKGRLREVLKEEGQ